MRTSHLTLSLVGALISVGFATESQATSTSAHTRIVSGLAGHVGGGIFDCATSGPDAATLARFNTGIGLPTEGYAYCGLSGAEKDTSNPSGKSESHQTLSSSESSGGAHNQTADAIADFSLLKVSSNGSYTGNEIGGFAFHAGEASAVSTDTLPTLLTSKFVQIGFTIDGSASTTRNSQILTLFNYQINSGPIFGILTANVFGTDSSVVSGLNGTSSGPLAGYTVGPGSAVGSDTVFTFLTEVTPGSSFDLTLGLYAASYPSPFGGVANNDFSETARLSSIAMYDSSMNAIDFGTIVGSSGRLYDKDGVHTAPPPVGGVPEPTTWAMMLGGFGLIGSAMRRSILRSA